ncbi:MAG TPA: pantetheine-phosphate adenylyltransferase [Chloroflexota bacterium]|nr:pantetheine-phosphate adenylyltransferase [Chloroflexota bacterium]
MSGVGERVSARGTVVYPGTFDPVTNGHLDVISRAAALFDRVVVAVVRTPQGRGAVTFPPDERCRLMQEATRGLDNVETRLISTLLVRFARECHARAIVKGLRAISDFEHEFEMAQLNRHLDPGIESFYLVAAPEFSFLSSTGVKEIAAFGADVSDLVPTCVAQALAARPARP